MIGGPPAPRRWYRRPLVAAALFGVGAYAAFLVTHMPQADQASRFGPWVIGADDTLTLVGPPAGRLLTETLGGVGDLSIRATAGAVLAEPSAAAMGLLSTDTPGFHAAAPGAPVNLRVANAPDSNATLTVDLEGASPGSTVDIGRVSRPGINGFSVTPHGAALALTLLWVTAPPQPPRTGLLLIGAGVAALPVPRAVIRVPAGATLYLMAGAGAAPVLSLGDPIRWDDPPGVPVTAATLGEGGYVRDLACAAPRAGALRWPRWNGRVDATRCTGQVRLTGFADNVSVHLQQPAFGIVEGEPRYLPLAKDIGGNFIIQSVFTALSGAFALWVLGQFKARKVDHPANVQTP